ncbi:Helicase conserved C-terminal domain-containing protein [Actinopolymorpha cephalotaxi]|uniref:Helicase conserved C-terminal domain-containing protein n=1 Tax=Actinopolymorpha cephalotaxi TaxID=504797 RepID=A0A1I2LML0_9ACTN|nr:DEAD/DEAH box helicase [Actinopolymorpha cephalotaxi]NYH81362.1 superfamily II RNA helicase [Actinopolymorpha cephalotaxi]SFF80534.1 Helicase conserved C-terminal domain-containing protein [Actinopolymorpha cephalotaxi]
MSLTDPLSPPSTSALSAPAAPASAALSPATSSPATVPLRQLHPPADPADADPDSLYETFVSWAGERGFTLYPHQEEALIEVVSGANVILATPTGSGKSLVAAGAHFAALAQGRRTYYTAPIKALVSEKFFGLCEMFGADKVGMQTGDASVNADAPIICCTAEILANIALRDGADADVGQVVMDEFHFYAEPDRGWAWQVPLIELPHAQFVLMSATLGDVSRFEEDLTRRTGRPTTLVHAAERPVPLVFSYVTTPLHETLEELLGTHQAPVYVVHFTQAAALERAQALMSVNMCTRAEKDAIAAMIGHFRFTAGFGRTLSRLVRHGIGVHHAGMLPRYRRLVETLAQAGLLKVICGTDTLGVGINVPIRTVLFTGLSKYDGQKVRLLKAREFHQIAGRAGRAGYDTLGTVVVQAPEHVVDNEKALAKAGDDPKKRRKVVRKKPPEGSIGWGRPTFERLIASEPEPLTSSFAVSHAMLLNVIGRPGDAFAAMRHLLTDNHEEPAARRRHIRRAIAIYRALLAGGVVERLDEPDETGRRIRLTVDLQWDFALNQPLSPFALAAIELLDKESPTYALDVVSVIESTLDDPRQVLSAQRNKARGEAVAAMKAEGIEYDERMELLEDVTHPRPLVDLLDAAYDMYRRGHPWVADHELSPKSVVRDMYEQAMTFVEYVGLYGLTRSEGLVLRYLADAFRALRQTVPEDARTEELTDLIEWLGELVRQVDSSLLDEWERLRNPSEEALSAGAPGIGVKEPLTVTSNARAFRVLVRNALFRRVELAALRRSGELGELDAEAGFDADAWAQALAEYFSEYDSIGTGPDARGPAFLVVDTTTEPGRWLVRQIFDDPNGDRDWGITAEVDLAASDEAGTAVVIVTAVGPATALRD